MLAQLESVFKSEIVCLDCLPVNSEGEIDISRLAQNVYLENTSLLKKKIHNLGIPFKDFSISRKFVNALSIPHASTDIKTDGCRSQNLPSTHTSSLTHGSATVEPSSCPTNLLEVLLQTVKKYPEKSIRCIDTNERETLISYAQLWTNSQKIAHYLSINHVNPHDNLILAFDDYHPFFQCLWGSVLNKNPFLSIFLNQHYASINAASEKFHNTWQLLNRPSILTSKSNQNYFLQLNKLYPESTFQLLFYEDALSQQNNGRNRCNTAINPTEVVFYQLTSGSTGTPKCIIETHKNVIQHINRSAQFNAYSSDDISLNWIMFDHVVPIITYHFRDMLLGCNQIHVSTSLIINQPIKWLEYLSKYHVTLTWAPNFGYQLLLNAAKTCESQLPDFGCIRNFMNAGEQVTPGVMRAFSSFLQAHHIPVQVMQPAFGMAEVATCMTYNNEFDPEKSILKLSRPSVKNKYETTQNDDKHSLDIEFVSLGSPIPGCSIRIIDTKHHVLPELTIGELQISGETLSAGYYKNENANTTFHEDGWFSTGDLGFIYQSKLYITGREKEAIIIRGQNFFCYEIEAVLHPILGIKSTYCAVTSFFDARTATEELLVFFVYEASTHSNDEELIAKIRRAVSSNFAINATHIIDVPQHSFPKTSSGKIQRSLLKQRFLAGEFSWKTSEIITNPPPNYGLKLWLAKQRQIDYKYDLKTVFLSNVIVQNALLHQATVSLFQPTYHFNANNLGSVANSSASSLGLPGDQDLNSQQTLVKLNNFSVCIIPDLYFLDTHDAQPHHSYILNLTKFFEAIINHTITLSHIVILSKNMFKVTSNHCNHGYKQGWLPGLINSIKKELKLPEIILLDLEGENVANDKKWIDDESQSGYKEDIIAFRQSTRYVMSIQNDHISTYSTPHSKNPFLPNEYHLIVGGTGGIGIEIAKYLINCYSVNLVITGSQHRDFSELVTLFDNNPKYLAHIHYLKFDVREDDINSVFINYQPKIKSIIYLVGTIQQIPTTHFTVETINNNLFSKSNGLEKLFDYFYLSQNPPRFIVFSSILSLLGPAQFSLYAAANSLCDAVCDYLAVKYQVFIQNIMWCPWNNIGMSQGLNYEFLSKHMGFQALGLNDCLRALDELIGRNLTNICVGINRSTNQIPPNNIFYDYFEVQPIAKTKHYSINTLARINNLDLYDQNHKPIKITLKQSPLTVHHTGDDDDLPQICLYEIWSKHLKIKTFDLGLHFFELGGDSLTAIQIVMDIRLTFGILLSIHDFLICENFGSVLAKLKAQPLQQRKTTKKKSATSYPLSNDQQRLWFQVQHCPAETYNVFKIYELSGALNTAAFEQAIEKLLQRFPLLRTQFFEENNQIYQKIASYSAKDVFSCNLIDSEKMGLESIQTLIKQEYSLLSNQPLVKLVLYSISEHRHFFLLHLHHLICDEWSIKLLASTLSTLYNAELKGITHVLEKEKTSFYEFSAQQKHIKYKPSKTYLQQIRGSYELNLPYGKSAHPSKGQLLTISLGKNKFLKLKQLAKENKVTPAILLHSLYSILLHFYSNQQDINIGVPITYREDATLKDTFGFLLNIAVIGSQLSQGTISAHIQQIRNHYFAAQLNKHVPFVTVLKYFHEVTRSVTTTPLFQAMFVYEDFLNTFSMQKLRFKEMIFSNETAKFHINFLVKFPQKDNPLLALEFYSSYLSPEFAKRMLLKMKSIISFYLSNPSANISDFFQIETYDFKIIQPINRHNKPIHEWKSLNQIVCKLLTEKSIFSIQYDNQFYDTGTIKHDIMTYANFIAQMKQKNNKVIAICLPTKYQQTVAILATTSLGYPYLPINYDEPAERIKKIVAQSSEICLFTDKKKNRTLQDKIAKQPMLYEHMSSNLSQIGSVGNSSSSAICRGGHRDLICQQTRNSNLKSTHLDPRAYIIFTSGTTGQPKGVVIKHQAVFNTLLDMVTRFKIHKNDVFLMLSSISFDLSIFDLFASIYLQAKLILPNEKKIFSPNYLLDLVVEQKVSIWNSTPGFLRLLINHLKSQPNLESITKTLSLRKILLSGDWVSIDLVRDIQQLLPNAQIISLGGATEASIWSNYHIVEELNPDWLSIPYGRALANQKLYVLNMFNSLCPVHVTGRLFIGGMGVASGYYKNKLLTKSKFITHPKFGLIYDTGDLAKVNASGVVEILGRTDDQVKIRGFRIELKEVELAIKTLDVISQVKVLAIGDRDRKLLVAFLVLNNDTSTSHDITQYLKSLLPAQMVPHFFIHLLKFPLTSNGKIDHQQLTTLFEEHRQLNQDSLIDTHSDSELNKIKAIFKSVLSLKREIGDCENFFELGGDSLSASYFISELNTALQCKIGIVDLFSTPTPIELRNIILCNQTTDSLQIKPIQYRLEKSLLSTNQLRLIFIEQQIDRPSPVHNMTLYYELHGPFNTERFLQASQKVFSTHKILSTKICYDHDGELQQTHENILHLNHNIFDFTSLTISLTEKNTLALQILVTASKKPFDLQKPEKFEITIVKVSELKFYLLMNFHHLIADGESIKTLFLQINKVYKQLMRTGKQDYQTISPESLDYFDYLQWFKHFEKTETYAAQLAFWRAKISTLPNQSAKSTLNADFFAGKSISFIIDSPASTQLKQIILEQASSGFIYILTIFKFCLYKLLKNNVSIIGTTVAARPKEFESCVGFFANTLPVITHIADHDSFMSLHKKVKQNVLEVLDNQFVSFEKIVGMLPYHKGLNSNPLFQIAFVYLKEINILGEHPKLAVQRLYLHNDTSKFDLTLYVHEGTNYLRFEIEYKTNQFTEQFISDIRTEMKRMICFDTIEIMQ